MGQQGRRRVSLSVSQSVSQVSQSVKSVSQSVSQVSQSVSQSVKSVSQSVRSGPVSNLNLAIIPGQLYRDSLWMSSKVVRCTKILHNIWVYIYIWGFSPGTPVNLLPLNQVPSK